ncbi:F58A4.6 family protein [Megaselia abdita]
MVIFIFIEDYSDKVTTYKVSKDSVEQIHQNEDSIVSKKEFQKLYITGLEADYLINHLENYRYFRKLVRQELHPSKYLLVKLVPADKEPIDKKWSHMTLKTLWEAIEMDYLMSWLSTLGGGYSALGDDFAKCAETAGKISLKQLNLGLQLGDPCLQSRCKLYYSISLIQTGRLRSAKKIIREEYKFAKIKEEDDPRLAKMCEGIWLKLLYEYWMKRKGENDEMPKICFEQVRGK